MKAIKKPVEIEFFPFERAYHNDILKWSTQERPIDILTPRCIDGKAIIKIKTLEGTHEGKEGECVIIKGISGEVYPCRKDIFEQTYEIIQG